MQALADYPDSDHSADDPPPPTAPPRLIPSASLNSAPIAAGHAPTTSATLLATADSLACRPEDIARMAAANPALAALHAPPQGPLPDSRDGGALVMGPRNVHTGYAGVEEAFRGPAFDVQYHAFQKRRVALAPGGGGAVVRGDEQLVTLGGPPRGQEMTTQEKIRAVEAARAKRRKKLERERQDPAAKEYPVEDRRMGLPVPAEPRGGADGEPVKETSTFHGNKLYDYQGRSFVDAPGSVKPPAAEREDYVAFVPKRCVHTWRGHTKGVSTIKLFPRTGHLLLSASMDCTVKIWTVEGDGGKVMRTYAGHAKSVRDICFSNDGRKFLSAAYDRTVKLWDTETGQFINSFSNRAIPYCVKFNPDEDKQNEFLAGCSDKKIVQYDIRTADLVQQYDQHLGAVNTIAFIDENRRFVSSSDDKSLRVWEWGIPVVIKYVSEPEMHSMPAVAVHPSHKWLCYQSLDNQIVTYSSRDRMKLNNKKAFKGHLVAGYACGLTFAPDGRFLGSGDSSGRLMFWDWKTTRLLRTLSAHQGVTIACEWHPVETSKVVTCGWDGLIKYWD